MPGFDLSALFQGPAGAIASGLGQGPGQPGGGGPQPLAPGAPAGAAPSSQGAASQQQTPQALQSPPDLAQMYMGLMQRQQAQSALQGLATSLVGMGNAMYPGRRVRPEIPGPTLDPGSVINNLMQLQQYQLQQQNMAAYRAALPQMLKSAGLDESLMPLAIADPTLISKIVEAQAGISGDPTQREFAQAVHQWQQANPGKTNAEMIAERPELAGIEEFKQGTAQKMIEQAAQAKDLVSDQHSFTAGNQDYSETETMLQWLKDHPDATAAAVHAGGLASGRMGQLGQATGVLPADTATAAGYLAQLQGKLYSDSWKGRGGRLSQLEAGKISEGFSQLNNPALPDSQIATNVGQLLDRTKTAHSNLFGAAGMPTPSSYYGLMDDSYKKGGNMFHGATELSDQGGKSPVAAGAAAGSQAAGGGGQALSADELSQAKAMIAQHGRDAVIQYLKGKGKDTSGL